MMFKQYHVRAMLIVDEINEFKVDCIMNKESVAQFVGRRRPRSRPPTESHFLFT